MLLALLIGDPALAEERATIPAAFHGDWAIEGQSCAPGPADTNNMRITAHSIFSFETRFDVRHVNRINATEISVEGQMSTGNAVFGMMERLKIRGPRRLAIVDTNGQNVELYVLCRVLRPGTRTKRSKVGG